MSVGQDSNSKLGLRDRACSVLTRKGKQMKNYNSLCTAGIFSLSLLLGTTAVAFAEEDLTNRWLQIQNEILNVAQEAENVRNSFRKVEKDISRIQGEDQASLQKQVAQLTGQVFSMENEKIGTNKYRPRSQAEIDKEYHENYPRIKEDLAAATERLKADQDARKKLPSLEIQRDALKVKYGELDRQWRPLQNDFKILEGLRNAPPELDLKGVHESEIYFTPDRIRREEILKLAEDRRARIAKQVEEEKRRLKQLDVSPEVYDLAIEAQNRRLKLAEEKIKLYRELVNREKSKDFAAKVEAEEKFQDSLIQELRNRYDYPEACKTLLEAFLRAGITDKTVLSYHKYWGGPDLNRFWSDAMYNHHPVLQQLEADRRAAQSGTPEALAKYWESLLNFKKRLLRLEQLLKDKTLLLAERAYWLDRKANEYDEWDRIERQFSKKISRLPYNSPAQHAVIYERTIADSRSERKRTAYEKKAEGVFKSAHAQKVVKELWALRRGG